MSLYSLILLLLFVASIISQSVQKSVTESALPLKASSRMDKSYSDSIAPLEPRVLSDWQLTRLIIASDIDGNLHGLDRKTGATIWTLPINEPLVQILGNTTKDDSNSNLLWFVEPFEDGSLFYFSPEFGLNKLPTSIKNLVMESPFSLNGDDKIYTGTRKTSLYTIDKLTGEVSKYFGLRSQVDECPTTNRDLGLSPNSEDVRNHIMLGKTTYELSIHSKVDSSVVWNVTYSHWGPNNIDNDLMMQNLHSADKLYFTPFHDKSLLGVSQILGAPLWMSRLPSMVAHVFDVFSHIGNGNTVAIPHPTKEFNALQHLADGADDSMLDMCFLNKTGKTSQWFAMSYANFPSLIKSAPTSPYQIALQKYDKGFLDQLVIEQMRNLQVVGTEAERFVSGVHEFGSLSSTNRYQPGRKFQRDKNHFSSGSFGLIKPNPWIEKQRYGQHPNFMDGILFPSSQDTSKTDLSIVNPQKGLQSTTRKNADIIPVSGQKHKSVFVDLPVQKVLMLRRITEDLIVMSTLILFLLVSVKVAQKFKYLTPGSDKQPEMLIKTELSGGEKLTVKTETNVALLSPDSSTETVSIVEPEFPNVSNAQEPINSIPPEVSSQVVSDSNLSLVDDEGIKGAQQVNKSGELDTTDQTLVSKKKRKRGSRGGKRGGKLKKAMQSDDESYPNLTPSQSIGETIIVDEDFANSSDESATPTISLVKTFAKPDHQLRKLQIDNNLVISNKVLGYGSHGTVVYEGTFENRPVAVKRMLFDFYDIANHEVRLLQESDDHPNVIRYFCSQSNLKEKFLYIALELCVCSLEDLIEKLKAHLKFPKLQTKNRSELLHQLASGLSYLHSLKIVHRDLKPQNILLGESSKRDKVSGKLPTRLLISDFGLCKKLDADQSSFGATTHHAASGTSGWRAPELLRPDDNSTQFSISPAENDVEQYTPLGYEKRLTKAIDIFSLGCVFFYILSNGNHPFGDRYLREANIIKGKSDLSMLQNRCPDDYVEATHLIRLMIQRNPKLRPDTNAVLKHPYFWSINKKLEFLLKVSDRFEIEQRDPPSKLLLTLEEISYRVHKGDWLSRFGTDFTDNLGKYRKYHTEKVMDLLRALRNKYHHYNDMPLELQQQMSPLPTGFYLYFNLKFPHLLMETYAVVEKHLRDEHIFHEFF